MTTLTPPAQSAIGRGRPPAPILLAFYLWWIPILLQAILLAYIALSIAEAARIGGPAWDIVLVDGLPALVTTTVTALEIVCLFRMRAGGRVAGILLIAAGIIMVVLAATQVVPAIIFDPSVAPVLVLALLTATTLGAIIAMSTPPATAFFRARSATPDPAGTGTSSEADEADRDETPGPSGPGGADPVG